MPNCGSKTRVVYPFNFQSIIICIQLIELWEKFDKVRSIYKLRRPTAEEWKNYEEYALDFYKYLRDTVAWVPLTSILHILVFHLGT